MYLSRVEIDVNNRQKTKDLTHLGTFHNWVEQSFPAEVKAGKRRRHLWRIDPLNGKQYLLVLSEEAPDLTQLATYGVAGTAVTKSYDPFLASIQKGQVMQFRLTANPTYAIKQPGKKQPRIVPHITIAQQRQWLVGKAEKSGFQLIEKETVNNIEAADNRAFDVISRDWPVLRRKPDQGGRGGRLSRVTFEGFLRVVNVATFKQALINGIGREKAFGMGLMTVIPRG